MKVIFALGALLASATSFAAPGPLVGAARVIVAAPSTANDGARRLSAILDYVASDYAGAVDDGKIKSDDEYAEQVGFLDDAARFAAALPPAAFDAKAAVAKLQAEVKALASPQTVSADARAARRAVLDAYGVVLAPTAPLSLAEGKKLYAARCAVCHGATGGGDGVGGAALKPPPRNFRDPAVMRELTPARAFNGITDGVSGTAMPSFSMLTAQERWDLAYTIFTLRHDRAEEETGANIAATGKVPPLTVADLAGASDGDLTRAASNAFSPDTPNRAGAVVAWYRGVAAFPHGAVTLDVARDGLDRALAALQSGDRAEAKSRVSEAYLAGFEPHEAPLRAASPELVTRVEEAFLGLRSQIDRGASASSLEGEIRRTQALLDDAEARLTGARGPRVAFVGSLLVALREGLEAALLLLLLLSYADRRGQGAKRWVHLGWIAALGAGVATWLASGALIALAGARRELIEGVVGLLAASVLVTAHHWIRSATDGRKRAADMKATLASGAGRASMALLAFGVVYREAFEVVLFLQAIALDGGTGNGPVLGGFAVGLAVLAVVVTALLRLGRKVKTGPLLTVVGILLSVMAVVFLGSGLRALQEAGIVPIHPFSGPRLDSLGIYPTLETAGAQLVLGLGLLASAFWPRLVRRLRPSPAV